MLDERVEQGIGATIGTVLAAVVLERFMRGRVNMLARQKIRHADRKTDDVAARGLELLALSATSMIALGLARLMRSASWSIGKVLQELTTVRKILT